MATIAEHFSKYTDVINLRDLKVKHLSGIYKDLPNTPDADDILYVFFTSNKKTMSGEDFIKHFGDDKLSDIAYSLEFLLERKYLSKEEESVEEGGYKGFDFKTFSSGSEEVVEIDEETFKQLFPRTFDMKEKLIITSTPVGTNHFYDMYKNYIKIEELANSKFSLN